MFGHLHISSVRESRIAFAYDVVALRSAVNDQVRLILMKQLSNGDEIEEVDVRSRKTLNGKTRRVVRCDSNELVTDKPVRTCDPR